MDAARRIVIVGGGPAGVGAAIAAKQQDKAAQVTLLSDEPCEPYEKPPLSKAVLLGKVAPEDAPIAGPGGLAAHGIVFRPDARVRRIDRAARSIVTEAGEAIPYDSLVLATGSINRVLPTFPPGDGIHYLRTEAEARTLKADLARSKSLILIGGGVIGLEVAASAAELGIKATVIEIAPRILARLCDADTSALIQERHRARGVDIRTGVSVAAVRRNESNGFIVETSAGDTVSADIIVVGAGALPEDRLAQDAGLEVRDGIIVDDHGRTSDPAIFAAGDCTRFTGPHGPVRLENWRHAQEHGMVAGRNAAGGDAAYNTVPSFWSEQFDMYIQGVGWPVAQPSERVRRTIGPNAMLLFELDGPHLAYAIGINAQRDLAMARRLIERRIPLAAGELADPAKPLAAMLKAKA